MRRGRLLTGSKEIEELVAGVSHKQQESIDAAVQRLKDAGIWDGLDHLYVFTPDGVVTLKTDGWPPPADEVEPERVTLVLSRAELRTLILAVQVGRAEMVGSDHDLTEEIEQRLQALLPADP